MKVILVAPWGRRLGGAENFLWAYLRNRDSQAIDLTVVLLEDGPFRGEIDSLGVRTKVIPSGRLRQMRQGAWVIRELHALFRDEQPDLIVSWMAKCHLYVAPAAMLAGRGDRLTWWQHGVPHRNWIDRAATALPARAVGTSSHASAEAQARCHPHRRTFVVLPGAESGTTLPVDTITRLRSRLKIPCDRLVVGIVGRLQPWKGQHLVLDAVGRLRADGINAHALIVGGDAYGFSPGYARTLRRAARRIGLDDAVTFTGQVEDATAYMTLMDALVNASAAEPFGIVIIEAMSLGIPVVAVDSAGPREILGDVAPELLVASPDADLFASALTPLLLEEAHRKNVGATLRRRFDERHTAVAMARKLDAQFLESAPGRSTPDRPEVEVR